MLEQIADDPKVAVRDRIAALALLARYGLGEQVDVVGILANLDMSRLPDVALERIRDGEHPLAVLASIVEGDAYGRKLLGLPPGSAQEVGIVRGELVDEDGSE